MKELSESDKKARVTELTVEVREWEELISMPGWIRYTKMLQDRVDQLQQEILFKPITSVEEVYMTERAKGEMRASLNQAVIVETALEQAKFSLSQLKGE